MFRDQRVFRILSWSSYLEYPISQTNNLDEKAGECHTIRSTVPTEFPSTIEKKYMEQHRSREGNMVNWHYAISISSQLIVHCLVKTHTYQIWFFNDIQCIWDYLGYVLRHGITGKIVRLVNLSEGAMFFRIDLNIRFRTSFHSRQKIELNRLALGSLVFETWKGIPDFGDG